jgi:RNA polymerase sigma-70 factor (ECF subfamily)
MPNEPGSDAWRRWLDENAGRLLLFARQQCRTAADAEDVVQEALVESWQRTGAGGLPPLPLVFATIRRRAIDRARSDDSRRLREDASAVTDELWFDIDMGERELCALVESGVKALRGDFREVVTLKLWGGLTFSEIAEILSIPANTAASRYRYGIEALRTSLKDLVT